MTDAAEKSPAPNLARAPTLSGVRERGRLSVVS
jgi:hypothetical protein